MGMFSFGGDTGETQDSLARKRAIADAMMQSQIQPDNAWSGAANAVEKISGALLGRKLDGQQAEMDSNRNQTVAQALATMRGTPEWKNPDNPDEGIPATAGDNAAAYDMLAKSGDPRLVDIAMKLQMQDMASKGEEQTWQSHFNAENTAQNERLTKTQEFQAQQNALNNARALEAAKLGAGSRYYAVPTSQGWVKMDKSTGATELISPSEAASMPQMGQGQIPGQAPAPTPPPAAIPYLPVNADPNVQGAVAAAKASASAQGTAQGEAVANLPSATQGKDFILGLINDVKTDPQLDNALGIVGSKMPSIPGYNSGVVAKIDQLKGNAFLQAFQSLKGGGQITEVEGQKAEAAQARLNRAQTRDEYQSAMDDMAKLVEDHYTVAQQKAGASIVLPGGGVPNVGDTLTINGVNVKRLQ